MIDKEFLETKFIDVLGLKTRYCKCGSGEPVVLLHGFPETLQTWRFVAPIIAEKFSAVALDMKGFGCTDKPAGDYSPRGMAKFIGDFMDAMNIESAHIVGTDIGFNVACAFALKYKNRIKKLVLMAGAVSQDAIIAPEVNLLSIKPLGEFILWAFGLLAIKSGLQKGFYKKGLVTKELFEQYYAPYRKQDARKSVLALLRAYNKSGAELLGDVPGIDVPTLILWAEKERFFSLDSAKDLKNRIKNSILEIIPGCGHFMQEEKPAQVAEKIKGFLISG